MVVLKFGRWISPKDAFGAGEDRFGRDDDASHHFDAPHHFLCCLVIGHHHWASSKEIFGAGVVFGDCVVATYSAQQLYKLAMV